MKVFLFESLEVAEEAGQTFSTANFGPWDQPSEIVSGDYSGQYWIAHKSSLEHYNNLSGVIVECDDELFES
jgi:hypothetical protein